MARSSSSPGSSVAPRDGPRGPPLPRPYPRPSPYPRPPPPRPPPRPSPPPRSLLRSRPPPRYSLRSRSRLRSLLLPRGGGLLRRSGDRERRRGGGERDLCRRGEGERGMTRREMEDVEVLSWLRGFLEYIFGPASEADRRPTRSSESRPHHRSRARARDHRKTPRWLVEPSRTAPLVCPAPSRKPRRCAGRRRRDARRNTFLRRRLPAEPSPPDRSRPGNPGNARRACDRP